MPTKDKISKEFNRLEKFGYQVYNFNSNRANNRGIIGFPDHVIVGRGLLIFIEVKRDGDIMSKQQFAFQEAIKSVEDNKRVMYFLLIKTEQAKELVEKILTKGV